MLARLVWTILRASGTAKDVSWSRSGDISQPRERVRRELESALKAALRKGAKSAFNTKTSKGAPGQLRTAEDACTKRQ